MPNDTRANRLSLERGRELLHVLIRNGMTAAAYAQSKISSNLYMHRFLGAMP